LGMEEEAIQCFMMLPHSLHSQANTGHCLPSLNSTMFAEHATVKCLLNIVRDSIIKLTAQAGHKPKKYKAHFLLITH
jgi:hypothetical protein